MRLFKWLIYFVIFQAIIFFGVAYTLPYDITVERSTEINASPSEIFPHVNSLQATAAWSPWLSRDPEAVLTYSGPSEGVGNKLDWVSDNPQVGTGSQAIVGSEQDKSVQMDLDFGPMGTATAEIILESTGDVTTVTWGFNTDLGNNPMARWTGLMMENWVGKDYESGLANLKALVEG
jgi:hypothetical protein